MPTWEEPSEVITNWEDTEAVSTAWGEGAATATGWEDTSAVDTSWSQREGGRHLYGDRLLFAGDGDSRYTYGGSYTAPTVIRTPWT